MGFLEKLWDETIAGPTPDSGLGKLRKYNSFSGSRCNVDDQIPVSRCIMLRSSSVSMRNGDASADSCSAPSSPLGSSTPNSPSSPSNPRGNNKKLTKKKSMIDPKSPKGYDWIVLSALDR